MRQTISDRTFKILRWSLTLISCVLTCITEQLEPYESTSCFITYNNGFISRGLIGSILWQTIPHEHYTATWYILCKLCICIITIYFNIKCDAIIDHHKDNNNVQKYLQILMLSPAIHCFSYLNCEAKLELFAMPLIIIMYECLNAKKLNIYIKTLICTILSIICILIHQGTLFVLIPFITLLLCSYKNKLSIILYAVPVSISFIACQFFGKIKYDIIYQDVFNKIAQTDWYKLYNIKDDPEWHVERMLSLEYDTSVFDHNDMLRASPFSFANIIFLAIILILFIPFLTILWKHMLNNLLNGHELSLLILSQLILNIMTIDLIRWFNMFIINAMITCFFIMKRKNITSEWPEITTKKYEILMLWSISASMFVLILGMIC